MPAAMKLGFGEILPGHVRVVQETKNHRAEDGNDKGHGMVFSTQKFA